MEEGEATYTLQWSSVQNLGLCTPSNYSSDYSKAGKGVFCCCSFCLSPTKIRGLATCGDSVSFLLCWSASCLICVVCYTVWNSYTAEKLCISRTHKSQICCFLLCSNETFCVLLITLRSLILCVCLRPACTECLQEIIFFFAWSSTWEGCSAFFDVSETAHV